MRRALLAVAAAAALTGCGTESSDLFVVERNGTLPGSQLTLLVKDDLRVECDGKERAITEDQLLEARDLARDLEPLLADAVKLRQGRESLLVFRVTGSEGTVQFYDSSPGLRPEFARLIKLTRDVARQACELPR